MNYRPENPVETYLASTTISAILGTIAAARPIPRIIIEMIIVVNVAFPILKQSAGPRRAYDIAIQIFPKTIVAFVSYLSLNT